MIAFDTETLPMGPVEGPAPRVICLATCHEKRITLDGNDDMARLQAMAQEVLSGPCVAHNAAYDLACLVDTMPSLMPMVWKALDNGWVHDTAIRERLFYLGFHGDMEFFHGKKISYGLAAVAARRTGLLIEGKSGDDIWRLRYGELDGMPAVEYPQEAKDYAMLDAQAAYEVYFDQEKKHSHFFATEELHVKAAFCLRLMTMRGLLIDHDMLKEVEEHYLSLLEPKNYPLLYAEEIILPALPPRPHKRGAKEHVTACPRKNCDCPPKMTKAQPEKLNKSDGLEPMVKRLLEINKIPYELTESGKIPTGKEILEKLAGLDPVIDEYRARQKIIKLKTSYFPKHYWEGEPVDTIHPNYNPLMKTGRVSSSGFTKGKEAYPSLNIQQADPRIRPIYVPRPGFLLASVDYNAIDLVSCAQTILDIYGHSTLADQFNQGIDPHTFMGSVLARDADDDFAQEVQGLDKMGAYEVFLARKETQPKWFKYWRKFAKPVGLGFPGGLGPKTMVSFASGYGIHITEDQARALRQLWFTVYPEMWDYLKHWVPAQEGPSGFRYISPLGMIRSGCNYTECANGRALQTPAAEGMKEAMYLVSRACFYREAGSILYGCVPVANMHDELLVEVKTPEQAEEIGRLMVKGMRRVIKDVAVRVEPALMKRWDKNAECVRDKDGRLLVWEK